MSGTRIDLRFERLQVVDGEVSTIDFDQSFRLKATQIARNQFANGPDLRGDFLIVLRKRDHNFAVPERSPLLLRQTYEERRKAMTNRGEGELLDDTDQPA